MPPSKPCTTLTREDILAAVDELLAHGWGQIRVVITEHYIKILEPTKTVLGHKPESC